MAWPLESRERLRVAPRATRSLRHATRLRRRRGNSQPLPFAAPSRRAGRRGAARVRLRARAAHLYSMSRPPSGKAGSCGSYTTFAARGASSRTWSSVWTATPLPPPGTRLAGTTKGEPPVTQMRTGSARARHVRQVRVSAGVGEVATAARHETPRRTHVWACCRCQRSWGSRRSAKRAPPGAGCARAWHGKAPLAAASFGRRSGPAGSCNQGKVLPTLPHAQRCRRGEQ